MALKATFTAGSDTTTVKGLYQWDYGQEIEIEATDIGSEIVEVHFACAKMSEAIVRSCTFTNGTGTVTIPDACLEQSSPIKAWIYKIEGTGGHTIKTITLTVTERTRPSVNRDIPTEVSDKYTELITEVNEAVEALESGDITAAKATEATRASHATSAGNASTASYATSAGSATIAVKAVQDGNGKVIADTYSENGHTHSSLAFTDKTVQTNVPIPATISAGNIIIVQIATIGDGPMIMYYRTESSESTISNRGYYFELPRNGGDGLPYFVVKDNSTGKAVSDTLTLHYRII